MTLVTSILASIVVFLDGSVVNVALPALRADLNAGLATQQWVVEAYLLTLGALILAGGSYADIRGRKHSLMLGVTLFAATSLVCAVAPSAPILVVAPALQGLPGAVLAPAPPALLTPPYEDETERGAPDAPAPALQGAQLQRGQPRDVCDLRRARRLHVLPRPLPAADRRVQRLRRGPRAGPGHRRHVYAVAALRRPLDAHRTAAADDLRAARGSRRVVPAEHRRLDPGLRDRHPPRRAAVLARAERDGGSTHRDRAVVGGQPSRGHRLGRQQRGGADRRPRRDRGRRRRDLVELRFEARRQAPAGRARPSPQAAARDRRPQAGAARSARLGARAVDRCRRQGVPRRVDCFRGARRSRRHHQRRRRPQPAS